MAPQGSTTPPNSQPWIHSDGTGRHRRASHSGRTPVSAPNRLGSAHTLSADARCVHPGLRLLEDGSAPASMPALAVYAVSRGWTDPVLPRS